jgi:predicted GIY-YIG superfamily endonuclease
MRQPFVYMMANQRNGTLYTGVTAYLTERVHQHRSRLLPGFTTRYGCTLLVWYERHDAMPAAIAREKQIKAGSRGEGCPDRGDESDLARSVRRPRLRRAWPPSA